MCFNQKFWNIFKTILYVTLYSVWKVVEGAHIGIRLFQASLQYIRARDITHKNQEKV